ncbi:MAG: O-antigen ligase family protein [Desulfobacterales bacterium]|nr:MAG: O-antigen ligase family protein [Desulfobacterales bacterium]
MPSAKIETLRAVLNSEYWLVLALAGVFFVFFALNGGGTVVFIHLSVAFVIVNIMTGEYRLRSLPAPLLIATAICLYLLLLSFIVAPRQSHIRWIQNLVRMLGLVFAIHCLSRKRINHEVRAGTASVLALAVGWQFAARHLFNLSSGTFSNVHYLAAFAVLVLPVIVFFFGVTAGWYRFLFVPVAIMDVDLLLQTGSRPAFVAIVGSTLFIILFFIKGRRKWGGVGLLLLLLGTLYITKYAGMALRLEELVENLAQEERVQFWSYAWNKLMDNTLGAWLFGHGIGWFYTPYIQNSVRIAAFVAPHNHVLELIYLNGLIGFVLVYGGMFFLFTATVNVARQNRDRQIRWLARCLLVVFLTWLIHCGLTFPFYSKYSQIPLAFILGAMLVLLERK